MAAIHWSSSSEPWAVWLADDALSLETQTVAKALQMSLSNDDSSPSSSTSTEPPAATSDPRRAPNKIPGPKSGKIGKRSSRAKKRTPTAYINVDPENFMAMVQQMTGATLADAVVGPVIKPEPRRQSFLLPSMTLEGPAFLLDRAGPSGSVGLGPEEAAEDELGFDVDSFLSFPTLESWGMA